MLTNVDSHSLNTELYFRSKKECKKIDAGGRLYIYELLGKDNGNSHALSIALEKFEPKGSSPIHYHLKAEEYQFILEGSGKLVIGNQTRTVTKGDFAKIPRGTTHQTINEDPLNPLKLFCCLTPAWTAEDTIVSDNNPSIFQDKNEIYMRKKENCLEIDTGAGEFIYELLGIENGSSKNLSIAIVEIMKGCSSEAHIHPDSEEYYFIIEGEGKLVIDGQIRDLKRNDLAKIPKGKVHQIFNNSLTTLKFLCMCDPAWTPECYIKI